MKHAITCQATLPGATADLAWRVWTDLASYPSWDPREEMNCPEGPLAAGMKGVFKQRGRGAGAYTITAVEVGRSWLTEIALPGGRLEIDHRLEPTAEGVTVTKVYTAYGPMALAFRWFFARGIRREMPGSFAALGAEIARRAARTAA